MAAAFRVQSTGGFDRLAKAFRKRHREFPDLLDQAVAILEKDPLNHTRNYPIVKLSDVKAGEGQYRLRLGRWRFRYDVSRTKVTLRYCGLRREDTYR